MGGSLSEGLRVVFAVVLSCLVIGFVFMVWNSVKESGNTALTDANSMVTQMEEAKYTQYDGAVVTGSEVVNVIRQHKNDNIYVSVDNGNGPQNYICDGPSLTGTGQDIKLTRVKTDTAHYVSPNAKFYGSIDRDETTDAILGIIFTKGAAGGGEAPEAPAPEAGG